MEGGLWGGGFLLAGGPNVRVGGCGEGLGRSGAYRICIGFSVANGVARGWQGSPGFSGALLLVARVAGDS